MRPLTRHKGKMCWCVKQFWTLEQVSQLLMDIFTSAAGSGVHHTYENIAYPTYPHISYTGRGKSSNNDNMLKQYFSTAFCFCCCFYSLQYSLCGFERTCTRLEHPSSSVTAFSLDDNDMCHISLSGLFVFFFKHFEWSRLLRAQFREDWVSLWGDLTHFVCKGR